MRGLDGEAIFDGMKLVLGTPAYRRQVDVEHVVQCMHLAAACVAPIEFLGFSYAESYCLDWSRNQLLYLALERGADWLLLVDADTFHRDAADTLRMLREGEERGAAVIGAPVRMRGRTAQYNVRARQGEDYFVVERDWFFGRVQAVDAIGTAFMAVSCNWMRTAWPQQPWFVTRPVAGREPRVLSEDLAFCSEVTRRGGKIFVDGRFNPTHVGAELTAEPGQSAWIDG